MEFKEIKKLNKGDKVAVVSPSFAAPGMWPHVYELGLKRLREEFGLDPVEYPTTKKLGATADERSKDLIKSFTDPEIKAVIATLGGDDQVTYIKNLPKKPFVDNPKPFFGFSDNTNFQNFLWLNGIPSYYGASLFTQFAMQNKMDDLTVEYINYALFKEGARELKASKEYNDINLDWNDESLIDSPRKYEPNKGWVWDGDKDVSGISWGGCLESLDEMIRHGVEIPALEQFNNIILFTETSEEVPSHNYVFRVYRALGERGILERVKGILVGRAKAWNFDIQKPLAEKKEYRKEQQAIILKTVRVYNKDVPVIQNMDFGHTDPNIPLPYGKDIKIDSKNQNVFAKF